MKNIRKVYQEISISQVYNLSLFGNFDCLTDLQNMCSNKGHSGMSSEPALL